MMWPFSLLSKGVDQRLITNATLTFGHDLYSSLRSYLDISATDLMDMQIEIPTIAISATNAFIMIRKSQNRRLISQNIKFTATAYALHFEKKMKGTIPFDYYFDILTSTATGQLGMEYTQVFIATSPIKQPGELLEKIMLNTNASISDKDVGTAIDDIAEALFTLIKNLEQAGL
ncbi:MAG: hypothetical protein ABF420_02745 [Acetobacter syzygii]|uniref:hypothetical protein n=1 Tax=Acetobacter syzygii TaxID=146476 RepID=UPI0039E9BE16